MPPEWYYTDPCEGVTPEDADAACDEAAALYDACINGDETACPHVWAAFWECALMVYCIAGT